MALEKKLIYGSVCSGIEAASVAWHSLGWQAAWLSEIEKFPSQVLAHRWPSVPNLGDMTKLHENKTFQESEIDVLVGGTPCQSFSVAGLRKGLDDPRGNLCLEFLRLVDIKRPRWFVWENVPGVLSSTGGRDFGAFLGAIQKLGYGFAYRILDAQYFGVPQRRRRVFVVGYLGDWRPAAAVLFERESLSGHIKASRKTRKDAPAATGTSAESGVQSVDFRNLQINEDGLSGTLQAKKTGGYSLNYTTGVVQTFDRQSTGEYGTDTVASTVPARDYKSASDLICFSAKDYGADASDKAPTLRAGGHTSSHANAGVMPAVCITGTKTHALKADGFDGSEDGTGRGQPIVNYEHYTHDYCHERVLSAEGLAPALNVSQNHTFRVKSCVRRLTPRECERLQGFPDDFTLVPVGKKMAADGPRYKALGNSMAVPVMHWIGRRIQLFEDTLGEIFFG